jgi:hypothetical protein
MLELGSDKSLDLSVESSIEVEEPGFGAANCITINPQLCLDQREPSVPSQGSTSELIRVRELWLRTTRGARVELSPKRGNFSSQSLDVGNMGVYDLLQLLELIHD